MNIISKSKSNQIPTLPSSLNLSTDMTRSYCNTLVLIDFEFYIINYIDAIKDMVLEDDQ